MGVCCFPRFLPTFPAWPEHVTHFTGAVLGKKGGCSHGGSALGQMGRGSERNVWHLGSGFATGRERDDLAKIKWGLIWKLSVSVFCAVFPCGSFPVVERITPEHYLVAINSS